MLQEIELPAEDTAAAGAGEPTARWRPDEVRSGLSPRAALAGAPRVAGDCFAVPPVLEAAIRAARRSTERESGADDREPAP